MDSGCNSLKPLISEMIGLARHCSDSLAIQFRKTDKNPGSTHTSTYYIYIQILHILIYYIFISLSILMSNNRFGRGFPSFPNLLCRAVGAYSTGRRSSTHLPRAPAVQVILSAAVGSVELLPVSCRCSHNPCFLKMCMYRSGQFPLSNRLFSEAKLETTQYTIKN